MKIAHITTVDCSLRALLLNQLRSIQEAGYEVVGISSPGSDVPTIEAAGIRHISVPMTRNLTPVADLISFWRLYRTMRRERFAVVHTHNPKPGLLGQLAARLAGVPLVVNTVHGFYFHDHMRPSARRFFITMEKIAAWCSDVILSQNKEDIETGVAEKIFRREKVRHLGNGIDLKMFDRGALDPALVERLGKELSIPAGVKVVGFVGRLAARRKGFLDFLRAGQQIAEYDRSVRFLIVGETDHGKPDAVEPSLARDFGIWNQCHFLGRRENSELPALYSLMNVLVLPSLFEGIPRVIMEAAAMGVPTVASDVKGNREAVVNGRSGILVPFGDVPALTGAVTSILKDPEKAARMGAEARRLALEQFDERIVFTKVKAEYARLAQQP
ncbi:MAG: glycosyltransferase family 4 protein [Verrucomicrobiota bacterium]|nr:glycosyltransferase family 4 protein [Verrucomicrobiota bacterium]